MGLFSASVVATGVLAGGIAVAGSPDGANDARTALVIDASLARDGRDPIDARLERLDAELRAPRTTREALTNVRYFTKLGYRLVVAGPCATAAADATGVPTREAPSLTSAVAAVPR